MSDEYKDDKIWIMKGDCFDLLERVDTNSVNAIIADPPYNTTNIEWDKKHFNIEEMWMRLNRIRKIDTPILLFGAQPFTSKLVMSNIEEYSYDWTWIKNRSGGAVTSKYRPLSCVETISVFYHKQPTYNPIMKKRSDKELSRLSVSSTCKNSENNGVGFNREYRQSRENLAYKYPRRDLYFETVGNRSKEKVAHPTQKPVELMEYLIKTYTNPGDTVVDFTMGSGSTGVACANLDRKFIGIELDETYFQIAKDRILNSNPLGV